jgi:putative membrane protein
MARLIVFASVIGVALLAAPVLADDKPATDNDFLVKSVSCSVNEVKLSELAAKQASNDKVKEFAARIAKDHKALTEGLLEQAKGLKVGVVTGLEKDQKAKYGALSKLKGADFDRQYMDDMVDALEKLNNDFAFESKDGKLDTLRNFATKNEAQVKKDLEEAKKIRDDLKK